MTKGVAMFDEYAMLRLGLTDLEEISGRAARRGRHRGSETPRIPATNRRRGIRRSK
jgi:hypothetical protein